MSALTRNHRLQVGEDAGQEVKEARLARMQAWTGKVVGRVGRTCRENPQGSNTELRGPRERKEHNHLELAAGAPSAWWCLPGAGRGDTGLGRRVLNKLLPGISRWK